MPNVNRLRIKGTGSNQGREKRLAKTIRPSGFMDNLIWLINMLLNKYKLIIYKYIIILIIYIAIAILIAYGMQQSKAYDTIKRH